MRPSPEEPITFHKTRPMHKMELRLVLKIEHELEREQRPPLQFHSGSYTEVRRRMVDSQHPI